MEDRRIRKTKQSIRSALLELMLEKSFDSITVNDIARTSDINRGTFYLHYVDKYALLEQIENDMLEQFIALQQSMDLTKIIHEVDIFQEVFIKKVMHILKEDKLFFKVMLHPNLNTTFEYKFRKIIQQNFERMIDVEEIEGIPFNYYFAFISSAQIGVIKQWVRTDMQESPEEIAKFAYEMAYQGPIKLLQKELKKN
ncbi:TetR/AcrR family transcriptional regulator [Macrococcoides caseolyticum]|uniref:TetR/AcrR family transcriptional regulator n=1 Tax=Macrococcoides caseolyticum TaxID=69966 RepID=UPI001F27C950|nr:TetR/AcrR family transcriptional regulator [Macrococcus caseolyticus]MCE4956473.1 TetR/AcrR family transcriptional regulator [Macrococcus caseolyticus]